MIEKKLRKPTDKVATDVALIQCAAKYKHFRCLTRNLAEEKAFNRYRLKVVICDIDDKALAVVKDVWQPQGRKQEFHWENIQSTLLRSHPRRLDLAMWCDKQLCGLAAARLSDNREWLSITHIEGSPNPSHPLKKRVVQIALSCADIYATLIENSSQKKPVLRILNPLKESMAWYAECGYSDLAGAKHYTYATCTTGSPS